MDKGRKKRRDKGALELDKAGKAPHAAIHAEEGENKNAEKGIGQDETSVGKKILSRNSGKASVKAEPEGEKPRDDDGGKVVDDQEGGNDLPMLEGHVQTVIRFSVVLVHGIVPIKMFRNCEDA